MINWKYRCADRIRVGLLCAFLLMSAPQAFAQQIVVTINGDPVDFPGIGPQQSQGRVLVPMRGVLEKLGANVTWIPESRSVVASNAQVDIQLHIGDRQATVNGNTVLLDVPAQTMAGHTMVPLRFLSESLGANVNWNNSSRTVTIVTNNPSERVSAVHRAPDTRPRTAVQTPSRDIGGPAPIIQSFSHDVRSWFHTGQAIHLQMQGTPGGQAFFRIPGLVDEAPLKETTPGRYAGEWIVPAGKAVQLSNAAVIGSLKMGPRTAPLIQSATTISVDAIPPTIKDRAPEPDSKLTGQKPTIYAVFDDQGSGVDKSSIRLLVDGKDVTQSAEVTAFFVSYTPSSDLPAGPQTVQVLVSDRAGNQTQSAWHFILAPHETGGIKVVKDNVTRALEPGDTLHVEMQGSPGGAAAFTLGSIRDIRMQEAAPGRYVGDYTIRKGDDVPAGKLAVRLATTDGGKYLAQSDNSIVVTTGKPMTPIITAPDPTLGASNPVVIKGKGTPSTKIHIKVAYSGKVLGVLAVQGSAADSTVTVDKSGNWQTEPINLNSLLANRSIEYTITAASINAANESSDTATSKFRLH